MHAQVTCLSTCLAVDSSGHLCQTVIRSDIAVLCRRLNPVQSQASELALKSIAPDDDFVIAMIRYWWHPAAAARSADQSTSTQGQLQAPFEALTAGHPQAAAVDQLAERLLGQRTEVHDPQQKQGSPQSPQSGTADLVFNQAEGTLQQRTQGSCQVQSFAGLEGSSHASQDDMQHQGSVRNERHSTD